MLRSWCWNSIYGFSYPLWLGLTSISVLDKLFCALRSLLVIFHCTCDSSNNFQCQVWYQEIWKTDFLLRIWSSCAHIGNTVYRRCLWSYWTILMDNFRLKYLRASCYFNIYDVLLFLFLALEHYYMSILLDFIKLERNLRNCWCVFRCACYGLSY